MVTYSREMLRQSLEKKKAFKLLICNQEEADISL
jgi:hypothetical protein